MPYSADDVKSPDLPVVLYDGDDIDQPEVIEPTPNVVENIEAQPLNALDDVS